MSGALKTCPQCGTEYPANARFCEIDGTALRGAAAGSDLVGSIIADRYHVMKKLGEGGMGQVYLVEHVKMGRKSALKVMHPGMVKDVDAISRFNREAANASRIAHANVAAVYDFGETPDGIIYLAMEFVDGPPLTSVIEQAGALPAKRAAEIVRQTGEALAVAHDMGIVHRDLKPDNIMIAKTRDGDDLVKVVDFGIAKAAGSDAQKVTKTGLVVGTPEYMSPEQLAGDKLDGRSDIYSLGLVAFNMLTGKLPFPSDSAQESMIMRLTDKPKPLGEMRPEVSWPPEVQAVMDKALERDASLRYQHATEFGRDLSKAIDRMPETQIAALGTQMISVPATRVSVASSRMATPGGGATAIVETPPISAPAVRQDTAPPKKKSMVPMMAGIAVVALGLVGAVVLSKFIGPGKNGANDPNHTVGAPNGSVIPAPTGGTPQSGKPADTLSKGASQTGSPGKTQSSGTIESRLAALESQATDSLKANTVITAIKNLFPQLTNPDDKARADYIRGRAHETLGHQDQACALLQQAIDETTDAAAKITYSSHRVSCGTSS